MTILPSDFAEEMQQLWTAKLGNVSNPKFLELWKVMGETFHLAITKNMTSSVLSIPPGWLVLAPEMGVGKTLGAYLYLSILAKSFRSMPHPVSIGGIFVARTIKQCDAAVAFINEMAGFEAAISRHSGNDRSLEECRQYPVVAITHAAIAQAWARSQSDILANYGRWLGGRRCLVIIDEALSGAIDFPSVSEPSLHRILSITPAALFETYPLVHFLIQDLLGRLRLASEKHIGMASMWDERGPYTVDQKSEMENLFKSFMSDLSKVGYSNGVWHDADGKHAELTATRETLNDLLELLHTWSLFTNEGGETRALTATTNYPGFFMPVLLNATASQDVLLDYRRATIIPLPRVRDYKNLTLHILRINRIGKQAMTNSAEARYRKLAEFVRTSSEADDKWMVVTHLATEGIARKHLPEGLATTAHWGDLDGKNDFRDCNKAILFGLSFRDQMWPTSMYFAMRGMQSAEWLESDEAKTIKHTLRVKSIAAQVIQAIGRPRSRKVIDADGNCLPTDIYLTLPHNALGQDVEKAIIAALYRVQVKEWDYILDASSDETVAGSSPRAAVVLHMKNARPSRYLVNDVTCDLQLTSKQTVAIKDGLKKGRGIIADLAAIGVQYIVEGERRGRKSYLVKR